MIRQLAAIVLLSAPTGCAVLHHVQIGDLDQRKGFRLKPVDVKVSETGINIKEARDIVKAFSTSQKGQKAADDIASVISMFQMGPRTGNIVFNEKYAENIIDLLHNQCPNGTLTGMNSIRETRKYPVVSGEIVKVTGYCLHRDSSR